MKRIVTHFLFALPLLWMSASCVKESSRGDAFEAEFQLNTPVFYDGDDVSFTIRTNRTSLKITEFKFPEAPDFVSVNETYSVTDGIWTEKHQVSVEESHRGMMSITVQDPVTGSTKTFKETYTAYPSTKLRLKIENDIINSTNVRSKVAGIVGGDDFVFTVYSAAKSLILKDFSCEFNDGQLKKETEIDFEQGYRRFTFKNVNVKEDHFTETQTMSLTFYNPETERDTTVTDSYVTIMKFAPEVSITPSSIMDGDIVTVTFSGNRKSYRMDSFNAPDWFQLPTLYSNSQIKLGTVNNKAEYETNPITIIESANGAIVFNLTDSEYSLREESVRVKFETIEKQDPKSVIIDQNAFLVNSGDVVKINVSTNDAYSTNVFHAAVTDPADKGKLTFYAPTSGSLASAESYISDDAFSDEAEITAGVLYVKAGSKAGAVKAKINAKNRANVFKEATITIRQDVALRIKGDFYAKLKNYTYMSDQGVSGQTGWLGFPRTNGLVAELVTYSCKDYNILNVNKNDVKEKVTCYSLTDNSQSPFKVSFIVTVGNKVTSNFLYGTYNGVKSDPHACLVSVRKPYTHDWTSTWESSTLPLDYNTSLVESQVYGNKITCHNLCTFLQNLDCKVTILYIQPEGLGFTYKGTTENRSDVAGYSTLKIKVSDVIYDKDKYNLKYIMNMLEVEGEYGSAAPWWNELSSGNDWIEEYRP